MTPEHLIAIGAHHDEIGLTRSRLQVVIDTSDLVQSREDLMKTKKVACFIEEEGEFKIAQTAPKGSIMNRIYEEKSLLGEGMSEERKLIKGNRCVLKKDSTMLGLMESDVLLMGSESLCEFNNSVQLKIFAISNVHGRLIANLKPTMPFT